MMRRIASLTSILVGLLYATPGFVQDQECTAPGPGMQIIPGMIIIRLEESALEWVEPHRQDLLEGDLIMGIPSLDSLNAAEGVKMIEPSSRDPRETLLRPRLLFELYFNLDVDLCRLLVVYKKNSYVADAWLGYLVPVATLARPDSWARVKGVAQITGESK